MTFKLKSSLDCSTVKAQIKGYKAREDAEGRQYTVYEIEVTTALSKWKVERRYRDFEYLQKQLKTIGVRGGLPPLPGKRYLGSSFDPSFLEERSRLLEEYLANVIVKREIWTRNDLVKFLDGETNVLTFIWNFGRMREMQQMLSSVKVEEKAEEKTEEKVEETPQKATNLETELRDAKEEVKMLQERIARMEMVFLQNAAGVAEQILPKHAMRRLTGDAADFQQTCENSDPDEDHDGNIDSGMPTPPENTSPAGSVISGRNIVTAGSLLRALGLSRRKPSFMHEFRSKAHSVDDLDVYRISLEIRDALTLSDDVLEDTYAMETVHEASDERTSECKSTASCEQWPADLPAELPASEAETILFQSLLNTHTTSVPAVWIQRMVYHTDVLIAWISPSLPVMDERMRVLEYVRGIVSRALGARLFPVGSFMLRTFLPDADIDATAFLCLGQEENWFIKVNEALCLSAMHTARAPHEMDSNATIDRCIVKNVSFINAEVKIVKALINNVSVDISANQLPALYSGACFDDVDRFVGKHFLFKRSVLLVKAWCKYESERFSNGRGCCFGSKEGRLSTFALNVMLTAIFNQRADTIDSPIQALILFLQYFSNFDWTKYALTVQGPLSAVDLSPVDLQQDDLRRWRGANIIPDALFDNYRRRFSNACASSLRERAAGDVGVKEVAWAHGQDHFYRRGLMNVLDPVWTAHNLNRSVTVTGAGAVCTALREGFRVYLSLLARAAGDEETLRAALSSATQSLSGGAQTQAQANIRQLQRNCPLVNELFRSTLETYCRGDGYRPDLGWKVEHRPDVPRNLFETRAGDSETSLRHAELVLANQVTPEALMSMVVHILEMKGPLPVGEIGKQLQEATGNPHLSHVLKEQYGGLKKFIEGISSVVHVGDDHPFNPHVYLTSQFPPSNTHSIEGTSAASGTTTPASGTTANPTRRTPPSSPHHVQPTTTPPTVRREQSSGSAATAKRAGSSNPRKGKPRAASMGTPPILAATSAHSAMNSQQSSSTAGGQPQPLPHVFAVQPTHAQQVGAAQGLTASFLPNTSFFPETEHPTRSYELPPPLSVLQQPPVHAHLVAPDPRLGR